MAALLLYFIALTFILIYFYTDDSIGSPQNDTTWNSSGVFSITTDDNEQDDNCLDITSNSLGGDDDLNMSWASLDNNEEFTFGNIDHLNLEELGKETQSSTPAYRSINPDARPPISLDGSFEINEVTPNKAHTVIDSPEACNRDGLIN